jgi:hypothetical protein
MNVLKFSSPVFGTVIGVQTKTISQVFPIKANQPEIQFDVVFRSEWEYEQFQTYIRAHQQMALNTSNPEVTLYWPERNMINWTGVIKEIRAGGMRRNYTPRASFTVDLIDSLVSQKTMVQSLATPFFNVVGTTLQLLQNGIIVPPQQNLGNAAPSFGQPIGQNNTSQSVTLQRPVLPAAGG